MYHLTYQHRPICQSTGTTRACEYSTRREAFDTKLKLERVYHATIDVRPGPCPNASLNRQPGKDTRP